MMFCYINYSHVLMKILAVLLLTLVVVNSQWIQTLDQTSLEQELDSGRQVWLVYRTSNIQIYLDSNQYEQLVREVSSVLKGFFRVAIVNGPSESLQLIADDRDTSVAYSGEWAKSSIIEFVLTQLDKVIEDRAAVAKALKAQQEYQEKETERANKEWNEEQELRKKSNTILLDWANWESTFAKSRDPFLINFYESNNSHCMQLNKEWELVSTELKGRVKVAKINLTEAQNHKLEDQIKLSRYPSVRFYRNGPKKVD